ncbi:unnamed protein product [Urochloa humidicola]
MLACDIITSRPASWSSLHPQRGPAWSAASTDATAGRVGLRPENSPSASELLGWEGCTTAPGKGPFTETKD